MPTPTFDKPTIFCEYLNATICIAYKNVTLLGIYLITIHYTEHIIICTNKGQSFQVFVLYDF